MKNGSRLWQVRYRFNGKENVLSLGQYPLIGLKEARLKRDEAKRQLAEGLDPSNEKKRKVIAAAIAASNSFSAVADEYIDKLEKDGLAPVTIGK